MHDTHQTNAYAMQGLLPHGVKESSRNETCSYIINTTIGEQDHAGIVWKTSPAATKDNRAWRHQCCGARARRRRFLSRASAGCRPRRQQEAITDTDLNGASEGASFGYHVTYHGNTQERDQPYVDVDDAGLVPHGGPAN